MFGKALIGIGQVLCTVCLCRYYEKLQSSEEVARVLSWAKTTGLLSVSDLFISADVDEVMSGPALQKLRCPVDAGRQAGQSS
jgi:hypothetical protein